MSETLQANGELKIPYYQPSLYAITINPCDDYNKLFGGNGRKTLQLHGTNTHSRYLEIEELIIPILNGYRFTLYFDVSCPTDMMATKFPRLHLHGIIDLTNECKLEDFLLITSQKLASIASVKMVLLKDDNEKNKWIEYCKKYVNVIRRPPITNKSVPKKESHNPNDYN